MDKNFFFFNNNLIFREIITETPDKIIIVDPNFRILFLNAAAVDPDTDIKTPIYDLDPDTIIFNGDNKGRFRTIFKKTLNLGRYYEEITYGDAISPHTIKLTSLRVDDNNKAVAVITHISNITDLKRANNEILLANSKLNMLSSVIRHDILNQIQVIQGVASLISDTDINDQQDLAKYSSMILKGSSNIEKMIKFTQQYHNLGIHEPEWIYVDDIILQVLADFNLNSIKISLDIKDIEIYADALISKVFYNLIDNSIRHGIDMNEIKIHFRQKDSGLNLIWEDNGKGIPENDKDKIFMRNVGDNNGVGLYIIKEILSLTGISIHEDGVYGKSARFVMHIPPGFYRFRKNDPC